MLYCLFEWLDGKYDIPGFGVFQYITFRSVLGILFSLVISLLIGKRIINLLRRKLIGESIRDVGPESHKKKAGTPTMGGLIIIAAITIPTLLWADITNMYVILILVATLWIGAIGFVDDYIKVFKKDKAGLKGKFKIVGQVGLGLIVGVTMVTHPDFEGKQGELYPGNVIRPGSELTEAGFEYGDRLISVNGEKDMDKLESADYSSLNSYLVERGDVPGKGSWSRSRSLQKKPV